MAEHTPTPWALMGRGDIIGVCKGFPQKPVAKVLGQETSEERAANIDLLLKAVNNHEALVDALRTLDTLLDFSDEALDNVWTFEDLTSIQGAFYKAKLALENVTGAVVGTPGGPVMNVCTRVPCFMDSAGYCSSCNPRPFYAPNPDPFRPGAVPIPMGQPTSPPHGCICPPTSEQTCEGPLCPRRNPFKTAGALAHSPADRGTGE